MVTEFQNLFQLIVLIILSCIGGGFAITQYIKKNRVFVLDSQMSKLQLLNGLVFIFLFLIWFSESLFYSISLPYHLPLSIFHTIIISNSFLKISGIFLLSAGTIIYVISLLHLGKSWRIGIDREKPGALKTSGIYAFSRNPVYISLDMIVTGTFLLHGYLLFLLLTIAIMLTLHIQILEEEKFLLQIYKEEFIDYCSRVGRYF